MSVTAGKGRVNLDRVIEPGRSYACVPKGIPLSQPLRAEVLSHPQDGMVHVRLHHPDEGAVEQEMRSAEIDTEWDRPPSQFVWGDTFPQGVSWAQIADRSYGQIKGQRVIAQRLTALGITRAEAHYAGRGGTSRVWSGYDASLRLTHDEFRRLLGLAELGLKSTQS